MVNQFDAATIAEGLKGPGMDTRQWVSFGVVKLREDGQSPVQFKDENGTFLKYGPLVEVTLQPSNVDVLARVASSVAGNQEGEWYPFVSGDEVIVAVPEGNEKAGVTIIGRLNNEDDAFPEVVAGMDMSKNNVGFRRTRAPYVWETAQGYLLRNIVTGSQFALTQEGNVFLNDSEGSRFFMTPDTVGISLSGENTSIQLLKENEQIALSANGSTFLLLDSSASKFSTGGTLNVGTSGLPGVGHAITLEQVINLLCNYTAALVASTALSPAFVATWLAGGHQAAMATIMAATISNSVLPAPFTPVGGGNLTALGIDPLLTAALTTQLPDPKALGVPLVVQPGLARSGFLI